MRVDLYTKAILTVIAMMLTVLAVRPFLQPASVSGQNSFSGVQFSRTPDGDFLFFDTRNGDLWSLHGSQWGHSRLVQFGAQPQLFDSQTGAPIH